MPANGPSVPASATFRLPSPALTSRFLPARIPAALRCTRRPFLTSASQASIPVHPRPTPDLMRKTRPSWLLPSDSATLGTPRTGPVSMTPDIPPVPPLPARYLDSGSHPGARTSAWASQVLLMMLSAVTLMPSCSFRLPSTHPCPTRSPMSEECDPATPRQTKPDTVIGTTQTWTLAAALPPPMTMTMVFSVAWKSSHLLLSFSLEWPVGRRCSLSCRATTLITTKCTSLSEFFLWILVYMFYVHACIMQERALDRVT